MRFDRIRSNLSSQRYAIVIAVVALSIAVVGPTNAANSVSGAAGSAAKALKLAKKADKRSKQALKLAKRASAKSGQNGKDGAQGPTGPQGPGGDTGPAGGFTETLPSGKTLRGVYTIRYVAAAAGESHHDAISFGVTLPSAPTPHFIAAGSVPQCPGNAGNPQANPGHLCIYESAQQSRTLPGVNDVNFNGGNVASPFGAYVTTNSTGAGTGGTSGSWAVTAP